MKKHPFLLSFLLIFVVSCTFKKGEIPIMEVFPTCDSVIHYSSNITAIVTTSCSGNHSESCHESGSTHGDYTIYSVLKSKSDNGSLYNEVYKYKRMPRTPGSISEQERANIYCWIKQGAPNN